MQERETGSLRSTYSRDEVNAIISMNQFTFLNRGDCGMFSLIRPQDFKTYLISLTQQRDTLNVYSAVSNEPLLMPPMPSNQWQMIPKAGDLAIKTPIEFVYHHLPR